MGQVVNDKDKDEVTVKFLKKSGSTFCWPNVEDISVVARQDVLRKLGEPQLDKRQRLTFAEKLTDIT